MLIWKRILCALIFACIIQTGISQNYKLQKLGKAISSPQYDEIAPCVSRDGKTLYFTRIAYPKFEKALVEGGKDLDKTMDKEAYMNRLSEIYTLLNGESVKNPVSSDFNQDIWVVHTVSNEFDLLEHPSYPLNNALPNSVSALTPDDQLIILNQFAPDGGMQKGFSKVSKSDKGEWQFPESIGIDQYHNSGSDVNLTLSSDGKVMVMAMEREDSYGKTDLYISYLKADGSWTYPENLGPTVNTPHRESAPHLSEDMLSLYYASDRDDPGNGNDIYVQTRLDDKWKQWWKAKRFDTPINSEGEDSHPYFNEATGYLYFTSDRDGTSDIFRIQIAAPMVQKILASTHNFIDLSVGGSIEINKIFFEQSKSVVLEKSYSQLHKLYMLLKSSPSLKIKIGGHTDNVGDRDLLFKLSEDRALAIKNYLVVKKGIAPSRIDIFGYGDTKPLNDNSTEELRSKNRRVEIEVISNDMMMYTGTK
jgi:outer membrane protein OmpA-like peptidoglycan-associated protein